MGTVGYRSLLLLGGLALALPTSLHPFSPFFFSLAGLFVVSLVSNATPFFGASYTLIATAELISFGFSAEAFTLVVGITAAGAAVGKLVIYAGAKGFQRQLSGNKNVQLLGEWIRHRSFLVAVFVAAVIPLLPLDDYLFIGAGGTKGRLLPMFSVTVLAKLVKSTVEIGLEFFGILDVVHFTRQVLGLSGFQLSIILSAFLVVLGIFLFKYDWSHFLGRQPASEGQPGPVPSA